MTPDDIMALPVREENGQMVPFSVFGRSTWWSGPIQLQLHNGYPALTISGSAAPGQSSGAALKAMERIAAEKHGGNPLL